MRISATLTGDFRGIVKGREVEVAKVVTDAVRTQANILKNDWRSQLIGAGLSQRLANAVRSKVYPRTGYSMGAAALVYPSKGSAEKLLNELENSAVITAARGRFLAIPTENVPRGPKGTRLTPHALEALTGYHLRFAENRRGTKMLVADTVASRGKRGGIRPATRTRTRQGRVASTTVFYILTPAVTIKKRLNLKAAAVRVGNELGALIAERLG